MPNIWCRNFSTLLMEDIILENNDSRLHQVRFFAQVAEKAGYTVAGVTTAYAMGGEEGLIAFALVMLMFAWLKCHLVSLWNVELHAGLLRFSLMLRMVSFGSMAYAVMVNSYLFLIIGALCSGLFVGLFWPSFYLLKEKSIGSWFVVEKSAGVILILFTGILVMLINPFFILLGSFIASMIGVVLTYQFQKKSPSLNVARIQTPQNRAQLRSISFIDGFIGEGVRMIRRLALLTGAVTLFHFNGVFSFALVLAISEAVGALIKHYSRFEIKEFSAFLMAGCFICAISTTFWLAGLILIGVGNAGMFPIIHEHVRARVEHFDQHLREKNRFSGRIFGALIASYVFIEEIDGLYLFFFLTALCLTQWRVLESSIRSTQVEPSQHIC